MTTENTTKLRRFGRTRTPSATFTPRKEQKPKKQQIKQDFKYHKDYVYIGQDGVDVTTLEPLTQEDYEYNAKIKGSVEVGKAYSYNQLCELLGEKPTSGNGKQSQLATWYQSMEWEHPINPKTKNPSKKMLITNIYDTPRQRINKSHELKYFKKQQNETNFIFSILDNNNLHEEVSDYGLITGVKAREAYKGIGLVNDDYYLVRGNKESISDFLPIENQIEVYSSIEQGNRQFTLGALNRLVRHRVIESYAYTYIWTDTYRKEHLATDQEHLAIENATKNMIEYAQECGYDVKTIADLYSGKIKDFVAEDLHDYMIKLIREEIPTIDYFCRAYKIVYLKDKMRKYVEKVANDMSCTLNELKSIKLLETRKEHTDIQVTKAMKRNAHEPLTQDREVRLINVVINKTSANPLTEQEKQQKEDRKFIIDRATVSEHIKLLAINDINRILEIDEETIEHHEQQQLDKLIEEAISYSHTNVTIHQYPNKKQIEFNDLNEYIDKHDKVDSLYIKCNVATVESMYVTLHINYTDLDDKKKSTKLELILDSMYDVRKLQAYLVVSYNISVKVGQTKPKAIN